LIRVNKKWNAIEVLLKAASVNYKAIARQEREVKALSVRDIARLLQLLLFAVVSGMLV